MKAKTYSDVVSIEYNKIVFEVPVEEVRRLYNKYGISSYKENTRKCR